MSSIDERIVHMGWDGNEFAKGVQDTLRQLADLNKNLKLKDAGKGFSDLASAAKNVDISHIGNAAEVIKNKFSAMSVVGIAALASLTTKAVDAGIAVIKGFSLDPIMAGFHNYETQINAVQTILANTGLKGKAGLDQVTKSLNDLNEYANKTVYNFSEMAQNIGTFTAAGVKLNVAQESIKGIANLAALSGSNSQQASTAMYQLSQAIAANTVHLQDWNSVVNAGLGGQVFQKALFNTGQALHTIKNAKVGETFEQWTKAGNSFRGSLQDGWITGKVLTQTLQGFTGDLTAAQLKSMGYNKEQIAEIQQIGKVALDSATQIKTFTQMTQALREEVASAWANVFKTLFGDINQAKGVFTPLHNVLQNFLTGPVNKLNDVLKDWVDLGGKQMIWVAIKEALADVEKLIKPIKLAFREIFPASQANLLFRITDDIKNFVDRIKIAGTTLIQIKRIFSGVFAAIDIGWQVVKALAHFLGDLFSQTGKASGGIVEFVAKIADWLVKMDEAIKKGQGLTKFFDTLAKFIKPVIAWLSNFIGNLTELASAAGPFLLGVLKKILDWFQNLGSYLKPAYDAMKNFFKDIFTGVNFDDALKVLDVGLLGGLVLFIKRIADKFKGKGGLTGGFLKEIVDQITEPFHQLNETLENMQKTLKAATLMEIAIAVGVLTASVVALSKIDAASLAKALTAMSVMFVQLFSALAVFNRIGGAKELVSTSLGLILFATAIDILTSAVKKMSDMDWGQLAKGLAATTGLIIAMTGAAKGMAGENGNMISTGLAMLALAASIKILTSSVKDFSDMNWGDIAKGLTGVASLLTALTLFTKFADTDKGGIRSGAGIVLLATGIKILASAAQDFSKLDWGQIAKGLTSMTGILAAIAIFTQTVGSPAKLLASGAALIGISVGIKILAGALKEMSSMSWGEIGKGLVTMAGALTLIAAAMNAMPPESVLSGGALLLVSIALVGIGKALEGMGEMSWGEIAKGLVTLAGALTIIALAATAMVAALPGAAAILVIAGALAVLAPVLVVFGNMSWAEIGKSMVELAGVFVIFGLAGLALAPVAPVLLVLGAAVGLLGVGMALAGAGVALFGVGLTAIAASGAAAAAAIGLMITTIVDTLPQLVVGLGKVLAALAQAIVIAAPPLFKAGEVLFSGLLDAITIIAPKLINTFVLVLLALFNALTKAAPGIVDAFLRMVEGFLDALTRNAPKLVNKMVDLMLAMADALEKNMGRIVDKGVELLGKFLEGIGRNINQLISKGVDVIDHFITGLGQNALKIANAAMDTIVTFVNGLAVAIEEHTGEMRDAGGNLAFAIADGLSFGLAGRVKGLVDQAAGIGTSIWNAAKHAVGARSPSTKFRDLGINIMQGLSIGLTKGAPQVAQAWHATGSALQGFIKSSAADIDKYSVQLYLLSNAHVKNANAIYLTTLALKQAQGEHTAATRALNDLNKGHTALNAKLLALGKQWDAYTPKIAAATQKLNDAKKARDDFAAQTKDQFNVLPDIANDTTVQDFTNTLTFQINDLKKFTDVLTQLRKLGLNDALYKELLAKGPASLQFAEQLLQGGSTAVKSLDSLSDQLTSAAGDMGTAAGTALYQAGVDAAQGIVDGLKKQQDVISAQMAAIAKSMVDAIKRDLGIKSPSTVFYDLAGFVGAGLTNGLKALVPQVQNGSSEVGQAAIDGMRDALSAAASLVNENMDVNPTIAPVIDLSNVRKGVDDLQKTLADQTLNVQANFTAAKDASAGINANAAAADAASGTPVTPGNVIFNQTNNSPKALSSAEIYRQTNNQLSRAKGALTPSAA